MTNEEFDNYLQAVWKAKEDAPSWRMGQTYFNVLVAMHPELDAEYRATAFDPFNQDKRIGKFLSHLYSNHVR